MAACGFFSGADSAFSSGRFSDDFPKSSLFFTASCASSWASRSCRSAGLAPFSARFSLVSATTLSVSRSFSRTSSFAA